MPRRKRMTAKMMSARGQHEAAVMKLRDGLTSARTDAERGDMVRDYLDVLENAGYWQLLVDEVDNLFKTSPQVAKDGWWAYLKKTKRQRWKRRRAMRRNASR